MQPKQFLLLFAAVVLYNPLFSQSNIAADYKNLMKDQEGQVQEFAKLGTALEIASTNYTQAISNLFEKEGIQLTGATARETNRRRSQLDWMLQVVPTFVSVAEDRRKTRERINVSVNEFADEFGLSLALRQELIDLLTEYAEAYKKYATGYNQLLNSLHGGDIPAPSLPPPPPPSQQHHRNSGRN